MSRAKRNSRQAGTGAAPVPLPQFYWVGDIATGAGEVSVSVRQLVTRTDMGGGEVTLDEIQITGQISQVMAVKAGDGSKVILPVTRIDSTSGTATISWDTSDLDNVDYYLVSLGWDNAIRGNTGQWMQAFNMKFTAIPS
jgi:hypothetical protein|tara:strand:+ start:812 stop:1228 length:417 start_codon:yes stop_codon:yes gene_type:complete